MPSTVSGAGHRDELSAAARLLGLPFIPELNEFKPTNMNIPGLFLNRRLTIFQMFLGHLQLVAARLDSADPEHFLQ